MPSPNHKTARASAPTTASTPLSTVTSQEVRVGVAEAVGGSTAAERQALRDWIRQAAGRLAQGLNAAGR
jgi:hypothetical protein